MNRTNLKISHLSDSRNPSAKPTRRLRMSPELREAVRDLVRYAQEEALREAAGQRN